MRPKLSLQDDSLDGACHRSFIIPIDDLGRVVLEPATKLVPDKFEGTGGTVTPSSGFTQLEQVMLGGAPYKFSKLSNYICHRRMAIKANKY